MCGYDFTEESNAKKAARTWVKLSAGYFPGRHIVAQASIEHSNIAQSEQNCFTTEKSTLAIPGNFLETQFI